MHASRCATKVLSCDPVRPLYPCSLQAIAALPAVVRKGAPKDLFARCLPPKAPKQCSLRSLKVDECCVRSDRADLSPQRLLPPLSPESASMLSHAQPARPSTLDRRQLVASSLATSNCYYGCSADHTDQTTRPPVRAASITSTGPPVTSNSLLLSAQDISFNHIHITLPNSNQSDHPESHSPRVPAPRCTTRSRFYMW